MSEQKGSANNGPFQDVENTLVKGVTRDIYVEVKNWLTSLDPTGKKLAKYRDGVLRALGSVQIMGMANPKTLKHVYVALRALPNIKKNLRQKFRVRFIDDEAILREQIEEFLRNKNKKEIKSIVEASGLSRSYVDRALDFESLFPTPDDYVRYENNAETGGNSARAEIDLPEGDASRHGLNALRLIKKQAYTLILGQPGSGKTTFLKYLALAYLGFVPVPTRTKPLLPIYVPLREFRRAGPVQPSADWLYKFAIDCASDMSSVRFSSRWIGERLNGGHCLLLLDGIDEVPADQLTAVNQAISAFKSKYGQNKIVATCRTASFLFGLEGFQICEIDDFNKDDVVKFAKQWFADGHTAGKFIEGAQSSKSSADLCRTPLLLTLLCISYEYSRSIPSDRAELYESCVDALLFRWDVFRSIERSNLSKELSHARKKLLLSRVARRYFDEGVFFFRKNDLTRVLAEELSDLEVKFVTAESVLFELEAHHGLFIERADKLYSFSHLSFHEFFTALSYVGENKVIDLAILAIDDPKYREVFLMGLEKMYDPNEVAMIIFRYVKDEFIKPGQYDPYVDRLVQDISASGAPLHRDMRERFAELMVDMQVLQITLSEEDSEIDDG